MLSIPAAESDDPKFVDLVMRLLNNAIRCYKPRQLYLIHIDNWFDHNWKGYAGRRGYCCNVWLDPLRPPPFAPGRVKSEFVYAVSAAEPFEFDRIKAPALHVSQSSPDNMHRRLEDISPATLYCWYSGNTIKNDRASLMVYYVQDELNIGWYVTFIRRTDWKLGLTKGVSAGEVEFLLR